MTSAFAPKRVPPEVLHYLNTRGAERVMWASDYPVLTYERCMKEISEMKFRDQATLENFLAGNAERVIFGATG